MSSPRTQRTIQFAANSKASKINPARRTPSASEAPPQNREIGQTKEKGTTNQSTQTAQNAPKTNGPRKALLPGPKFRNHFTKMKTPIRFNLMVRVTRRKVPRNRITSCSGPRYSNPTANPKLHRIMSSVLKMQSETLKNQ